jgi:murein DD-endopeptidase MepM/ murein hydrolase activator NlpD
VDPRSALPPIRFPVAGNWLVLNPPGHPPHAYDISRLGPGGRLTSAPLWRIVVGRARPDDIFGWQTPVEAPVAGHVVEATDGIDDRMRLNPLVDVPASLLIRPARAKGDLAQLAGNHVIIESGGLYVVLAHLRRGSLAVREGERIELGQPLGVIGNSGNTLAPHLHLHVMDGPNFRSARIVPFRVDRYERWLDRRWVPMHSEPLPRRRGRIRVTRTDPSQPNEGMNLGGKNLERKAGGG